MPTYAKLAIGLAAVVVVAVVGLNALPGRGGGIGGSTASPSPSPTPVPTASPSPRPSPESSPNAETWPTGKLERGRHDAALRLCDPMGRSCNANTIPFSFVLPSSNWQSDDRATGILGTGTYPTANNAWMVFLGPIDRVSTDPCAAESKAVKGSTAEMANALTTIPGTDAVGPADITVGGRPAKLVTLTIHDDVACELSSFWLFGNVSLYPNTLESVINIRVLEVDGEPFIVYTDQSHPNPALEQEIQQIVDSITFE
jgi:hypothetical protein